MIGIDVFAQPIWRNLVFALVHTLWQGALLAALLAIILRRLPARHQDARYLLSMAAQFGLLLTDLTTWAVLNYDPPSPTVVPSARVERRTVEAIAGSAVRVEQGISSPATRRFVAADGPRWVPIAAVCWLVGVAFMLLRAAGSVLAATRLTRGPRTSDRALLDAVDRLRRELRIGRNIRVISPDGAAGPAVFGLFWPTLILPATLLTGLPPEALRAILAHELAHIRRHDYAWNLAQMLVEALLFFNPAAWWIGRQGRLERESCCDAIAVRLTGRPLDYSRLLADWAEQASPPSRWPAVAAAWSGDGQSSTLLDRVRRIVRPDDRPRARISATGLLALLLIGPLILVGLWRGTSAAVALAAQVLTPAERLEKLKGVQAEYAPPTPSAGGKATLKGTIRTADGKALRKPVRATARTEVERNSTIETLDPIKETFSIEVPSGLNWISVAPEDYAPTVVGPFTTKPGGTVDGIAIVLEPGFRARIRVVDDRGEPIAGARVGFGLITNGGASFSGQEATDADGLVLMAHAAQKPYSLSITAPGFHDASSLKMTPTPDATIPMTLTRARPTRGLVVSPDGAPIAGAKVRVFAKFQLHGSDQHGSWGPFLATTDAAGRFLLDALDDDASYALLIESEAQGRRLERGVKAGQEGLRWVVGPDLAISGTVKGDLNSLKSEGGKPVIRVTQAIRLPNFEGDEVESSLNSTATVERTEGGGRFRLKGMLPGPAVLHAGRHVVSVKVEARQNELATIDLTTSVTPASMRQVVLCFVTPDGAVRPTGTVEVTATVPGEAEPSLGIRKIEKGEVMFESPAPGQDIYHAKSVVGYWFKEGVFHVEPGEAPLRIDVPAVPAGGITGRVLLPDGTPAVEGVSVSFRSIEKPPGFANESLLSQDIPVDTSGRFFLTPIPLGGTYVVVAGKGHNKQVSEPVRLDEVNVTEDVSLKLARPVSAEGRVIDPDGRPLAGVEVSLDLDHPQAGTSWGPPTPTDRLGRFRFDDLSSELGDYRAIIDSRKVYRPVNAPLKPGGRPIEIRLERGEVVEGRIIDAATGWPIPGVEVFAILQDWRPGEAGNFGAEARSDERGRFRFSNLPNRPCMLNDREGLRWKMADQARIVTPGRVGPIEIRATLPAWSKRKLVPPPEP